MCCFSGPVPYVANTRIFARAAGQGRQYLAYQMDYSSARPVAMILPLPLRLPASENSVRFIDLQGYPTLFADLLRATQPQSHSRSGGMGGSLSASAGGAAPLRVVEVGDFVASVVPTVADFRRVDPRFAISPLTWAQIPAYHDYGFAVFQLASATQNPKSVHPMAFEFDTRLPDNRLFFPTVHIHDGRVHAAEEFDHSLYYQKPKGLLSLFTRPDTPDNGGVGLPTHYVDVARTKGLVEDGTYILRQDMRGRFRNQDTIIDR